MIIANPGSNRHESADFQNCRYKPSLEKGSQELFSPEDNNQHRGATEIDALAVFNHRNEKRSGKAYSGNFGSQDERNTWKLEIAGIIGGWRKSKQKSVLGILNNLLYWSAIAGKAAFRGFGDTEWKFDRGRLRRFAQNFQPITTTLAHTVGYLNRFWGSDAGGDEIKASISLKSVRSHISDLRDMGLLTYTSKFCEEGEHWNLRVYDWIDIERLLVLVELLEDSLLLAANRLSDRAGKCVEAFNGIFPKHGGVFLKGMFNAFFGGGYRAQGNADAGWAVGGEIYAIPEGTAGAPDARPAVAGLPGVADGSAASGNCTGGSSAAYRGVDPGGQAAAATPGTPDPVADHGAVADDADAGDSAGTGVLPAGFQPPALGSAAALNLIRRMRQWAIDRMGRDRED